MNNMAVKLLIKSAIRLKEDVEKFADKMILERSVEAIYNPLTYAWKPHKAFIELGGGGRERKHFILRHEPWAARNGADGNSICGHQQ